MNVTISVPIETLAYIIEKAREFDAEVEVDDPQSGSNPADDRELAILQDTAENPTEDELTEALRSMNDDELAELLALVWVGRGDFDEESWDEALTSARAARDKRILPYLMGTPMLGDLVAEGLAELGYAVPPVAEEAAS
jgi:hypothetical protein